MQKKVFIVLKGKYGIVNVMTNTMLQKLKFFG
jgi:hypothetical protein